MIKKIITTVITLWVIAIGIYLVGANYYQKSVVKQPFKLGADKLEISVKKGDTLNGIINSLASEGKLSNMHLLKYHIKKNKLAAVVKPGKHDILNSMTLSEFIEELGKGTGEVNTDVVKVTIPEGYDIEKIAKALEDKGIISKDEFIKSAKEYSLPGYVKKSSKRKYALEGFLFPDTYEFKKGTPGPEVIKTFINRFEYVIDDIEKKDNININSGELDKIVTMASVVEKEVVKAEERPLAASVFYNRLSMGKRLESCATVLYALGVHKDKLLEKDLKVDSPYNTYVVDALPEGPICSPGRASIEAALKPAQTSFLYFVSRNDGTHEFNESWNAHLNAVRKYQGN